ncbi:MAG: 2-dehydropantoate 2-reductase [Rhodospirillaceae bacterium]|jgi:2-dehydropantoate 2-reductase|nr:2-dehydropantoate 2-reductase [Rhodospirillaceae bacterium]MBT6403246.1 2-dehydropantoate 2-reductase [Rhodospirillaceae bacterium]MBT6536705.1 2-dehydropantoate 2-reductase [Rhodospirillaceae bacterium]MBT7361933.1 2-dehydropantoate 2-reductase [Rhodospirillaceae bacterium]
MTDKPVSDKRIAIVGTGANGAAFGADMVNAGLDVSFIEQWPDHVEAMRADGLRVEMPDETVTTPVNAFHLCDVATMRAPFDVVFLGVKAYDTRWACELIKPLVAPDGLVVGLQNGMTLDDVAAVMGPERTMGAVIEVAAGMYEAGVVIRQTGPDGTWFGIGAYDDATRGREQEVVDVLRHAGAAEIKDDIRSAKWMKLVVNAAEFLPSSILGLPLADAIKVPGMREVMMASGREAVRTALALGHDLVPIFGNTHVEANDPDGYATVLLDAVLSDWTLPDTKVTVLQDWLKGRRAEVDDINGLVIREQLALGGAVPVNAGLVEIAHRIEQGELEADVSNADLLRSLLD